MRKALIVGIFVLAALFLVSVAGFFVWRSKRAGTTGLVVHLSKSQKTFRLGEPMYFDVVVINMSLKTVKRHFQSYLHDVFEIRGPDGTLVPYAVGIRQTCGEPYEIKPFRGLYVRGGVDILEDYSITNEGPYTIRVRKLSDELPASNKLRFIVRGGTPLAVDEILRNIRNILPTGWRAGRCSYTFDGEPPFGRKGPKTITIQITRRYTHKNRIDIDFTKSEAPEDTARDPNTKLSRFLGKNKFGFFYFTVWKQTDQTWPTHEKDLKKALNILEASE